MIKEKYMLIGDHIYALRQEKYLTQKELANELFVSSQLISNWERHISEPTTEMLLKIIKHYQLPFDYFTESSKDEPFMREKEAIVTAFVQSMVTCPDVMPTLSQVSKYSDLSLEQIKKYFSTTDELIYEFIVIIDRKINLQVSLQVENNKDIVEIFVFDMTPMLYERRAVLNLLYSHPYVKDIWTQFITEKYHQLLLTHQNMKKSNQLDLEYLVELLTTFISVWLRQENPESLEVFQNRVLKLFDHKSKNWIS
ncbi:XRE family transcriptional regulator [Leuconostoc pseudomesenteroides]|nr:XRE family transcriptional regulator [Leuconostoc pseudomesenteroides]